MLLLPPLCIDNHSTDNQAFVLDVLCPGQFCLPGLVILIPIALQAG